MKPQFQKYRPFTPVRLPDRQWPDRVIEKAPIWCSVDLRDGNQALVDPMNMEEKLEFFKALCDMGFKEIEVGFPSASETEYAICRELIEGGHIPDDVTIQVLVQAREHLIRRTFEAIRGAKNVIVHFYNSTSTLQRKVVFHKEMDGIIGIAVEGARLIRELTESYEGDTRIRYEYSPESFSGTEMDNAVAICAAVMEALGSTKENPVILNLPNTVEMCTANTYADQVEYFIRRLPNREAAVISIHPHNDRGTGVAASELALLAGAERVEGTLFGNGERTGNLDIVTMGLNMYTQGVDPGLDFSRLPALKEMYERCTKMRVPERQPSSPPSRAPIRTRSTRGCSICGIRVPSTGRSLTCPSIPPMSDGSTSRSSGSIPSRGRAARPLSCRRFSVTTCPRLCIPNSGRWSRRNAAGPAGSSPPTSCSACSAGIIWKCRGHTPWPGILCSRNRVARTACISKAP